MNYLIVFPNWLKNYYSLKTKTFPIQVNYTMKRGNTENPAMVWEVDKCKADGRILLRRNTQISNGILHQYLGFAPTGKPTPTLIHPEEMGEIIVEKV